jgi:flavin reductase (DIM6/NTAB) family NADH-FMN oxidoreductase RutF
MRIHLTNAGAITLCEPDVFNRLDVLVDPQARECLDLSIARIGTREDETHVRLSPSVLRFLSGRAGDAAWETGFGAMLDYAARKAWLDEAGNLRAHLVFRDLDAVVSLAEFKQSMRLLPAGISAITTGSGAAVAGMIVSSLTSISAEPPMVGFFAHRNVSMRNTLLTCGRFVASVLGEEHGDVVSTFLSAPQGPARFASGNWSVGEADVPLLSDALTTMECEIVCTQPLGTHDLIVGKVRKTTCGIANPMVNFNASTHVLAVMQTAALSH